MDYAGDKKCLSFHPPEWKIGRTLQFIVFQLSQRQCAESSEAHDIRLVVNISSKSWSSLASFIVNHCCERPWPSICTKTILKASDISHVFPYIQSSTAPVTLLYRHHKQQRALGVYRLQDAEYMKLENTIYIICSKNLNISIWKSNVLRDHDPQYVQKPFSRRPFLSLPATSIYDQDT
jgi:hypothetical protein